MILVTGATGHFGKATIDHLLNKGVAASNIAALVRDEHKAQDLKAKGVHVKIGDYNQYDSLVAAFKGVDKLLLVSSNDLEQRTQQQLDAVKAAKEAGVKHIYYTSFERKNETATSPIAAVALSHVDTEKAIKESGLTYTIFKNNLYMEVFLFFFGDKVLEQGIYFPAGNTKAAYALRDDMAEAMANVLVSQGHENKSYSINHTDNVSLHDVAATLSELAGKPIAYNSPSPQEYVTTLTQANVPTPYIHMFSGFAEAIKQGEFETTKTDLEHLLGRKPTTLKEFLRKAYFSQAVVA
jgi:NAD(P)H dehydrogenase (quinone)